MQAQRRWGCAVAGVSTDSCRHRLVRRLPLGCRLGSTPAHLPYRPHDPRDGRGVLVCPRESWRPAALRSTRLAAKSRVELVELRARAQDSLASQGIWTLERRRPPLRVISRERRGCAIVRPAWTPWCAGCHVAVSGAAQACAGWLDAPRECHHVARGVCEGDSDCE